MNRGAVLNIPDFEFRDGGRGNKLLVVLNEPKKSAKALTVKTTSVPHNRKCDPGCQPAKREFFIRGGKEFPEDTWIVLSSAPYLFPVVALDKAIADGKCRVVNTLAEQTVNAIRNCLKNFSDDLNLETRDLLG